MGQPAPSGPEPNPVADWHAIGLDEVQARLTTGLSQGLAAAESAARLAAYGPNAIREARPRGPGRILAAQFADFMILVLLAAAVVAGFLGEPQDAIAIVTIVILNAVIGFVQEYRAQRAIALLKQMAAQQARVVRGGEPHTVAATELVPGDVVLLEAGNSIPADLRIGEAADLRVDESALTGESHPVGKHTRPLASAEPLPLGDRRNMAYKGTVVTYGRGRGIVAATGMSTELGRIAALLEEDPGAKTPLQRRLTQFGKTLALAALGICGIIFAVGVQQGVPVVRMFLTSVSLAVAAIPEALPAVVTITLALGARKMLKANALVRKLPAVETLGSVTYICSDKTGTLTENRMRLTRFHTLADPPDAPSSTDAGNASGETWDTLYTALAISNDAGIDGEGNRTGDPTEAALFEAAAKAGYDKAALSARMPRIAECPFDSERKRMSTIHRSTGPSAEASGNQVIVFTKGGPEAILECCDSALTAGGPAALDRHAIAAAADGLAAEGLRVLAVAFRRMPELPPQVHPEDIERSLTFLGLVGLIDPPRAEARESVRICTRAGIVPVMITGDHPATARAIASQLGIATPSSRVLTGPEMARLDQDDFEDHVRRIRVYARVDPAQKLRIVEALQKQGDFVAMTGDGVNDAPALQRADIGVAMGLAGTDVAREAADLVLLDDNFATIVGAVQEGRHIFDNIRKFIKYILASNTAEILTIFTAPLLGLPVPLLPIHILWTNLVTDGLPAVALAVEPPDPDVMQRPPRPPGESLFARGLWQYTVWVGILIAGLSLYSQAWAVQRGLEHWQTFVFTVLTLSQMTHVLAARSERDSVFRIGFFSNLPLLGAVMLTVVLQLAAIYWPPFQRLFRTSALTAGELTFCLLLCSVVFVAIETKKWMSRRGWLRAG